MDTPTPDVLARAFGLGRPVGELVHVRSGDTETWRLDTTSGSYFLKGYRPTTGGQFVEGELSDQLRVAMAFERLALDAGVVMPEPIPPVDPFLGWLTRIDGRIFRAYEWIDHRGLTATDDIADWLGRTMVQVHRLRPPLGSGLPKWWRGAIRPRGSWEGWIAEAHRREKPWAGAAEDVLPSILEISARIEALIATAPDCVTTHGDFKTHNLLMTPTGPVLVDWDTVRVDSAALEAARVAYIFGAGEPEPISRILTAYMAAGGAVGWAGSDLFLSVARNQLQGVVERVLVSLGHLPAPRWMDDDVEQTIGERLHQLPGTLDRLTSLASSTSPY